MSQVAYKETKGSYIGQNYDTLVCHTYTIDYPKRQWCDTLMYHDYTTNHLQRAYFLLFLSILLVNASQESFCRYRSMSTLRICFNYN